MSSSTTLVNVDADTASELNDFISRVIGNESTNFSNETKQLLESEKTEELISKYLEYTDKIFALEDSKG
jgi:hypothetical protein